MKIITEPKLQLQLNKKEAKGVRKVYVETLELFKSPKNWIKGEFYSHDEYDNAQYCLIGAVDEVDGPWQDLAEAFMLLNPPKDWEFDFDLESYREEGALDDIALGDLKATGRDEAMSFNDSGETNYKDVTKWLRSPIKKTDKIIAA